MVPATIVGHQGKPCTDVCYHLSHVYIEKIREPEEKATTYSTSSYY